jgi:hypothetical protein
MVEKVGILRILWRDGLMSGDIQGELTNGDWIVALELAKVNVLRQLATTTPIQNLGRKVDRPLAKGIGE